MIVRSPRTIAGSTWRAIRANAVLVFVFSPLFVLPLFWHPRVEPPFWVALAVVLALLRRPGRPFQRYAWVVLLFAAWGAVMAPHWPYAAVGEISRRSGAMDWLIWGWLALLIVPRIKGAQWGYVLWALAFVGAAQGVVSVILGPSELFQERGVGLTANPGVLGFWGMIGAIASFRAPGPKAIVGFLFAASVFAIVDSGSRAAMLGVVLGMGAMLSWRKTLAAATVAAPLLWLNMRDGSDSQRSTMWEWTVQHLSLWGHGIASFRESYPALVPQDFPHSMPLQLTWEFGLLGLAAYFTFSYYAAWNLRGVWRSIFIAWWVWGSFWFTGPPWFLVGALILARLLSGNQSGVTAATSSHQ